MSSCLEKNGSTARRAIVSGRIFIACTRTISVQYLLKFFLSAKICTRSRAQYGGPNALEWGLIRLKKHLREAKHALRSSSSSSSTHLVDVDLVAVRTEKRESGRLVARRAHVVGHLEPEFARQRRLEVQLQQRQVELRTRQVWRMKQCSRQSASTIPTALYTVDCTGSCTIK